MNETQPTLTPKAQQTRQRILDAAINQFIEQGYEKTTMRDIAAAANCSLGLTYRYFGKKEDLVLGLWEQLANESAAMVETLPEGTIAERYYQFMLKKLEQITPYRDALGALFGAAMNPNSGVAIVGSETVDYRDITIAALHELIESSTDMPDDLLAEQFALLLYGNQLILILVWLYDRAPEQRATRDLLDFSRETMKLLRPALVLPFFTNSLSRLASIVARIFLPEKTSN
jgi:AcrR family transcriptional regulator